MVTVILLGACAMPIGAPEKQPEKQVELLGKRMTDGQQETMVLIDPGSVSEFDLCVRLQHVAADTSGNVFAYSFREAFQIDRGLWISRALTGPNQETVIRARLRSAPEPPSAKEWSTYGRYYEALSVGGDLREAIERQSLCGEDSACINREVASILSIERKVQESTGDSWINGYQDVSNCDELTR